MASMAFLISCILLLVCASSSFVVLCRDLVQPDSLSENRGSAAAVWQYDRTPYSDEEASEPGDEEEDRGSERREKYGGEAGERSYQWRHEGRHEQARHHREHELHGFVLDDRSFIQQTIISTNAGEMTVILPRNADNEFARRMIGLSILTLEPNALLLPHYTNTHCLFMVYKGKGRISWVNGDNLEEMNLKEGDVYKMESGTLFYLINTDGQNMDIFSIHDAPSGSLITKRPQFHTFFVAAGWNLGTLLSGLDEDVLTAAFNVSGDKVYDVLDSYIDKPIIHYKERNESKQEHPSERREGKNPSTTQSAESTSSWQREALSREGNELNSELFDVVNMMLEDSFPPMFGNGKKDATPHKPLNILEKKPIFSNEYGSTTVADETEFGVLKDVNKGVFSVKLKAGAMLAPHWNPKAMEIGLVTEGKGEIHVVYPDGRGAFIGRLNKGSIFYVPPNFVMCQVSSSDGVLEFLGFSTSSRPNNPNFLAGSNSVLRKLNPGLLASSFNIPVKHMQEFLSKQHQAVVLPGRSELIKN